MLLRGDELLGAASAWIAAARNGAEPIVTSEVEQSSAERDPRSLRWILESSERMGQIVLWADGQAEFDLADIASGEVRSTHAQIDDQEGLDSVLGDIRDWVLRRV